ncbi:MAG: NAD(P)-dependent oxidoreductase [Deltaproteobacteria bacterium]|nr:NAD(P)-dependent oxidoreductase [Deltaproteobacteria bacterium]
MSTRAGFVGLGSIGRPMARRLCEAGLTTTVYDLAPDAVAELVAAGARAAASARAVAAASDVVGVCVRDDVDVQAVVLGDDGLLAGAAPGCVIAIHSTVLPHTVRALGATARARGIGLVDACVTGGPTGAAQGRLTYMVGGAPADVERCRPVFATAARAIVPTGALGSGAATKLCNNLMTYLGFLAAFEATTLARAAGLSTAAFEEVTRSNGNLTDQMQAFLMLHRLPDEQRREPDFQRMLRAYTTLAEKDLAVTLAFAREHGLALPGTGLCQQVMARVYGLDDPNRR